MQIIDTHVHLWDPAALSYPWLEGPGLDLLARPYLIGDYEAASAGVGITGGVFVECDPAPEHALDEARFALGLRSRPGFPLLGVVARVSPESASFPAELEALLALPGASRGLKGARRVLHTQPDELSASARFRENVSRLGRAGLSFDLCVLASQLPVALALAEACPDTRFVLDHCGVPDVKAGAMQPWASHLEEISRLPNVCCKISGLVAYASPGAPAAEIRPFVEHAIACFGWQRVLFGGDWPVCLLGSPLASWVKLLRRLADSASPAQSEALFAGNARRVYRLD